MKTIPYTTIIALASVCVLASCSSAPQADISRHDVSFSSSGSGSMSDKVFRDVNSYRLSHGRKALKRHKGLDALAQKHCEALARSSGGNGLKINHKGFRGRAVQARNLFNIPTLGENVAATTTHTSQALLRAWKNSKNHEHNMRSKWTYTGVGSVVTSDGKVISTQLFGSAIDDSFMTSRKQVHEALTFA